jgi:hypothetical protein
MLCLYYTFILFNTSFEYIICSWYLAPLITFWFISICIVKSFILVIFIFINYVCIVMSSMLVNFILFINIPCTFIYISFYSCISILIHEYMEDASMYFVFAFFSKLHMTFNKYKDLAWFYFRPIYMNEFFSGLILGWYIVQYHYYCSN